MLVVLAKRPEFTLWVILDFASNRLLKLLRFIVIPLLLFSRDFAEELIGEEVRIFIAIKAAAAGCAHDP